ncbi:MAG: FAD-binding oxidoreductase [bacterium]|nr:FAD-binding oxidoreductase [bacterium]
MSNIAKYLNGHILGEVSARESRLKQFSTDRSILKIEPKIVVYPRITDDVRKIMRFSWQLAEKGHTFGVTARGFGGSTDGSSIGEGIILDLSRHLDNVEELDLRAKTVRAQAGTNFAKLNLAIGSQAMSVLQAPAGEMLTVGGAIAMNLPSEKYNYGELLEATRELEVVLANGDLIQTRRISKRELDEKLALQNFEGDIYREIDTLIEDNFELISKIEDDASYGYAGISKVKNADGSFDLTPLFFGSLGTLGVVNRTTFSAEYITNETEFAVISFENRDDARDFIDMIRAFRPDIIDMIDGKMFEAAVASGKKYQFYIERVEQNLATKLVLVVGISERNQRKIASVLRKIEKAADKFEGATFWKPDGTESENTELEAIRDVRETIRARSGVIHEEIFPIQGVYVPLERFEQFYLGLQKIAQKFDIPAPIQGSALTSIFEILAEFDFSKVSDRRKAFEFLAELNKLLATVDGELGYGAGEGRIYGSFVAHTLGAEVEELNAQIRQIFDPHKILNPGVKANNEPKNIAKLVRNGR